MIIKLQGTLNGNFPYGNVLHTQNIKEDTKSIELKPNSGFSKYGNSRLGFCLKGHMILNKLQVLSWSQCPFKMLFTYISPLTLMTNLTSFYIPLLEMINLRFTGQMI